VHRCGYSYNKQRKVQPTIERARDLEEIGMCNSGIIRAAPTRRTTSRRAGASKHPSGLGPRRVTRGPRADQAMGLVDGIRLGNQDQGRRPPVGLEQGHPTLVRGKKAVLDV